MNSLAHFLAFAALVAGLVLPTGLPELANITYFVIAGVALLLFSWRADWRGLLSQPTVALPLAAGVLLALTFAITADAPADVGLVFYFVPLFLVVFYVALFARAPRVVTPGTIGLAATAAAAVALGVACYDVYVLGLPRGGDSVNNPIHFGDLALTVGFVALAGLYAPQRWVRIVVLAGPVMALVAVLLSGSRGPLVAAAPMAAVALLVLLVQFRARIRLWPTIAILEGIALVLIIATLALNLTDELTAFSDAAAVVLSGEAVDNSVTVRLLLYHSAFNAFMASPVFGHGLADFIATTASFAPAGSNFPHFEHLHSDIADFAVIGGLLGLLAYGLFLFAPIAGAAAAPRGVNRNAALYIGAVVSVGYLGMGVTNAMFGILSQTVLFAVVLTLVGHLGRADTLSKSPDTK